jgi:hypothetical protein
MPLLVTKSYEHRANKFMRFTEFERFLSLKPSKLCKM